jgi:hypothetical protein
MGFLDKLFGRDKQHDDQPAAAASTVEEKAAETPQVADGTAAAAETAKADPAPTMDAPADDSSPDKI